MNILTPTADNSNTLFNEEMGEHYHSKHGALQESKHVFIDAGLKYAFEELSTVNILEVGFGTGLNFLLSAEFAIENKKNVNYTGLEAHPLTAEVIASLGYQSFLSTALWEAFISQYEAAIEAPTQISSHCNLKIEAIKLQDYTTSEKYDLVYFDAFSVRHQPEMWTNEMIAHVCAFIKPGGTFVTYAITGDLKRAVKSCGFEIQKLQGAPGKREMLRAIKLY